MKERISKKMPMIFTFVGYSINIILIICCCIRFGVSKELSLFAVMCLIYILWSVWEMRISMRELQLDYATYDKNTLEVAGVVKIVMISAGLFFLNNINISIWVIGVFLMVIGILIRIIAINNIGETYSHRIRKIVGTLATGGAYRIIRHPAYLGTLIIHTGLVIIMFNYISLIALFIWYGNAVVRIMIEENILQSDSAYSDYMKMTKYRLIPFLW